MKSVERANEKKKLTRLQNTIIISAKCSLRKEAMIDRILLT